MPPRSRGRAFEAVTDTPAPSAVTPIPRQVPQQAARPARPSGVLVRFRTAAAALAFVSATGTLDGVRFHRSEAPRTWWVGTELRLTIARELAGAGRGEVYVETGDGPVRDRGWGEAPAPGAQPAPLPELTDVTATDLLRAAGLHRHDRPAPDAVSVLLPGKRVTAVVQRAIDLGLTATHRVVRLDPLFDGGPAVGTLTELRISRKEPLPGPLLGALDRDPRLLVTRVVDEHLLVQHDRSAPLADPLLAELALRDGERWLLADAGFGSARVTALTPPVDATSQVRLADGLALTDVEPGWSDAATEPPEPIAVRVVPTCSTAEIDAVLLERDDLTVLAALLVGRRIADIAQLVRGRDRHLLLAPGGLLERLPVGVPLHRVGPGPLYVELGHRLAPRLPPSARSALFGPGSDNAVVLLADAGYAFQLAERQPVWELWAGPLPQVDHQLPRDAIAVLTEVDRRVTPKPPPPPQPTRRLSRLTDRLRRPAPQRERTWQDEALEAEQAGNLAKAAELHERHGHPRQAGYLFERAAREARE